MSRPSDSKPWEAVLAAGVTAQRLVPRSVVALEVTKSLIDPRPFDLTSVDLNNYKGLLTEWREWTRTVEICKRTGEALASGLIAKS